jgi:zinc transport system ATP-binding protein
MLFGSHAVDKLAVYRHHHDHTHLPDGRVQHADGSVTEDCHPIQESAGTEHEHERGGKHHA